MHDITMFQGRAAELKACDRDPAALIFHFLKGITCIGNSGYASEPDNIVVLRPEHPKGFKIFMAMVKTGQETFITRLKVFRMLTSYFHDGARSENNIKMHEMCVEMMAVMVQSSIENGSPFLGQRELEIIN